MMREIPELLAPIGRHEALPCGSAAVQHYFLPVVPLAFITTVLYLSWIFEGINDFR